MLFQIRRRWRRSAHSFFLIGVICQMLFWGLCADDNMQIKGEVNREKRGGHHQEGRGAHSWAPRPSAAGQRGMAGDHGPRTQITVINLCRNLPGRGGLCYWHREKYRLAFQHGVSACTGTTVITGSGRVPCRFWNAVPSVLSPDVQRNPNGWSPAS